MCPVLSYFVARIFTGMRVPHAQSRGLGAPSRAGPGPSRSAALLISDELESPDQPIRAIPTTGVKILNQ